ncbi:hypothetical protein GCM10010399_23010 [Dactylosporangium fulvum]|uniref:DUF4365 domain-containing protein n=1 Tax=Dactylosporangium fulvum TaxID=53359 RepID=A0ABY5VWN2_9ACTN|nr:hypothetical protein [Dactylosporangium fulvum]UWP82208.1 hypothetical protein Dfulv_45300 [Dactylosporangium fulvum]
MADNQMTKSAGEHWVCSVLARRGWAAALTRDGLERTDVLAVQAHEPRRMIEVQVKTANSRGSGTNWLVGAKAQQIALSEREWFAFVILPEENAWQAPRTFIVPRDHVGAAAWIVHQDWLTDPSVAPGIRNTPVDRARVNVSVWAPYEDRWDLLDQPAFAAPVLLAESLRDLALDTRVGLPPGHPWKNTFPAW